MRIGNTDNIRNIDNYCIHNLQIPSMVLMENAALKVVKHLESDKNNSFVIVCGKGNNGGDGLAVARHLHALGKKVDVFLIGISNISEDCNNNYKILKNMGISVKHITGLEDIQGLRESISFSDVVVDGIFGTGLTRNVSGIYDLVITVINENSPYTVAIDISSGINGDTGKIMGNCIRADKTISFVLYKRGFLIYKAHKLSGDIIVESIGVPENVINKFHENEFVMDREFIGNSIKKRNTYGHKGEYGRSTIIAASEGFTGSGAIVSEACVKSGAGLVTLCTDKETQKIEELKLLEAMTLDIDNKEAFKALLNKSNVVALGPGMGNKEETLKTLEYVLEETKCPLVIDADGINVLEKHKEVLEKLKNRAILTPHLGEMSRLCGISIDEINENRLEIARNFANENQIVLVLKGYNTIITDGNTTYINPTGNSAMANGGMGDTLTGIITALVSQGYSTLKAAALGTYIHGYAGDKLSKDMFVVNASHIIKELPYVIKELSNN